MGVFLCHAFVKTWLVMMISINIGWHLSIKTTQTSEGSASNHLSICDYPHITPHKRIL